MVSLEGLIPELAEKAKLFIEKAKEEGFDVIITQALRTWEEQDALYAKGRTVPPIGKKYIVTQAQGGQSWHNFGRAIDFCPLKDGKPWWNAPQEVWAKLGAIGKSLGLAWGGDWPKFKDLPHLELTEGKTLAQARAEHQAAKPPQKG